MKNVEILRVVFMNCDYETIVERMKSRQDGREDDNLEVLAKRYNTFLAQTMPLIEEFQKTRIASVIDCTKSKEETYNNFISALNS